MIANVEAAATEWVKEQLATFRVEISNTIGATRDAYRRSRSRPASPRPSPSSSEPTSRPRPRTATATTCRHSRATCSPTPRARSRRDLNDWETEVVNTEIDRPAFVAWYRNPARATPTRSGSPTRTTPDDWATLQPDFIVVSRRDDGSLGASIVDPHGDHLADARAKLRALADFAEIHGDRFVRIVSVAKGSDGSLRVLDLLEPHVREAVRDFDGAQVSALYDSAAALPYL